ncbi:MAG: response regulator [Proteobacteria bacterium]|nr:response regulator [Pseudomonadota bacterium]
MGAKRALIVDDSKSARLFLARVLQDFEIDVDSAETAEAAIDYLSSNRPDVIFMDHQMPGMDGLQAVQAIKNDPRTATIPIMMYTSQEGELYLGQARALGALGVLPKQIKPADVSKVLYQLHLVPDRRIPEQSSFTPVGPAAVAFEHTPTGTRPLTDSTLREHFAELRRALIAVVDTQTDRITAEVRASLRETLPPPAEPLPPPAPPTPWAWAIAGLALAVALASTALWWRSERALESLGVQLAQLRSAPAASAPQPALPVAAATAPAHAVETRLLSALVPYGADAFGGPRLEVISKLLYRLARQGTTGLVEIKSYAGRFCMVGSAAEGYSVAPEEMPYARCDVVGNPADEALTAMQRVPLPLVNLIGDIRSSTHGALDVEASVGDPANLVAPYPPPGTYLTAGEWNRAASANNRIEIRLR